MQAHMFRMASPAASLRLTALLTVCFHQTIDVHYGAIAKRAVLQPPAALTPTPAATDKFHAAFGLTWEDALEQGWVGARARGSSSHQALDSIDIV